LKLRTVGEGEAEYAVMYCVHGNEVCGKLAVDRIIHERLNFQKPVKLVFANEKAYRNGQRQVGEDLNRAWHSDAADVYEANITDRIKEEIEGKTVLDIHSSYSHINAFGLPTYDSGQIWSQIESLGVNNAANIEGAYSHQLENCRRVPVECGYTQSEEAVRNAYRITKNFLKANDIIQSEAETGEPDRFQIYDSVEGSGYQFLKENFSKVRKGETFAVKKGKELKAEEDFHPVLMSTTGYDDMIGFKAEKLT
jgi:predicted deacylase